MTTAMAVTAAAIAALSFAQQARADTWTVNIGPAVAFRLSGVITGVTNVSPPDPNPLCGQPGQNPCRADPPGPGTFAITGISGTFSDPGIGIFNAPITALVPISPANERDNIFDPAVPTSLSFIDPVGWSYDNLFFPNGSPIDCAFPFSGTLLDPFGVAFTIAGGDTVDVWGDGNYGPDGALMYGVAVTDATRTKVLDYQFAAAPEPSTWAMLLLGFAGLGVAGSRRLRKAVVA